MKSLSHCARIISLLALIGAAACSANPPPTTCGPALACGATQPDRQKSLAHFQMHVTYPATRQQILAACAQTKEFGDSEKQWIADNLPEGTYSDAQAVAKALKL